MDPDDVVQRRSEQPEGVLVPQVGFRDQGQKTDVVHGADVLGPDAFLFHQGAVVGDVVPDVPDLADDLFVLDAADLLRGGGFDSGLVIRVFHRKIARIPQPLSICVGWGGIAPLR